VVGGTPSVSSCLGSRAHVGGEGVGRVGFWGIDRGILPKVVVFSLFAGAALLVACAAPPAPPAPAVTSQAVAAPATAQVPELAAEVATPVPSVVPTPTRDPGVVLVFAASSLSEAFPDVASAFLTTDRDATGVQFTFGTPTYLRAKLEQGADADVFVSSDQAQLDAVRQANRIEGADQVFASNRLVLLVPTANPKQIHELKDLANPGIRWATTDPKDATEAETLAMLDRASTEPTYGADFRTKAERNILSRIGSPSDAIARVQDAEADASVVSASDVSAAVRAKLQVIEIPAALGGLSTYVAAAVKGANTVGGQAFAAFLVSKRGQDVLAKFGFTRVATGDQAP
jgi:molybdate transport system substrate-binding protein